jgi:hypothetical protein
VTGYWYRLDILSYVYKLGLVLEGWIPHISVGVEICKLGLVLRVGLSWSWCSFQLVLITPEIVVSCNNIIQNLTHISGVLCVHYGDGLMFSIIDEWCCYMQVANCE